MEEQRPAPTEHMVPVSAYVRAAEVAGAGLLCYRPDGALLWTDAVARQLLELPNDTPLEGMLLAQVLRYITPPGFPPVADQPGACLAGYEALVETAAGTRKSLLHDAWLVGDRDGNRLVIAQIRDITARCDAEQAARAEAAFYRAVAEFTSDWEYVLDAAGNYLYMSPSCEQITGYRSDEFMADPGLLDRLIHSGDREGLRRLHPRLDEHRTFTIQYRVTTRQGEERWIEHRCRPMFDSEGRMLGRRVNNRDITQRKRAEKALRNSERRSKRITESVTDYVYTVRVRGGQPAETVHAPNCEAVTGYTPEEFYTVPYLWIRMVPEEDQALVRAEAEHVLAGEPPEPIVHRIVRKDGVIRWVRSTIVPHYSVEGELVAYDGIIRDITEQREAEEALRASELRFRRLFEEAADAMILHDTEGRIADVNGRACENLGYSRAELSAMAINDIAGAALTDELRRRWETLEEGQSLTVEGEHHRKDGSTFPVEIHATLFDNSAKPPLVLAAARDISERKRAEAQRKALERQVQQAQKLESLGVLAGGVAHDFNNLLMSIMGNVELARNTLDNEGAAVPYLHEVEAAGRRAADLCQQMLACSGQGGLRVEGVDLNTAADEIVRLQRISLPKEVAIACELQEDLPVITGDPAQLRQVLMSLLANAAEAIGQGPGDIQVKTYVRKMEAGESTGSEVHEPALAGEYVCVEVADNGAGMDEHTRKHLFDPFFTTKFTGRGLGLAAVLGIVHGHHGEIQVTSAEGEGSTFTVLLPRQGTPVTTVTETDASGKRKGLAGMETVLLVDDEKSILNSCKFMLERFGYTVFAAEDGEAGVAVFRENAADIDVVVLDLAMPRMNGEEAMREMREMRPEVPIVLSSGYAEPAETAAYCAEGNTQFIQKPYPPTRLIQLLRTMAEPEE